MRGDELDVHRELVAARALDGNLDATGLTTVTLSSIALLVAAAPSLSDWLSTILIVGSLAALTWLIGIRRRRVAARVARVLEVLRDHPDRVAEVAHRGSMIELFVIGGDSASFLVPAQRTGAIVAALVSRCANARVHAGRPQASLRAAPVARLVDRS